MKKRYDVPQGRTLWQVTVYERVPVPHWVPVNAYMELLCGDHGVYAIRRRKLFTTYKQAIKAVAVAALDDCKTELAQVRQNDFSGWVR